jgi:hypothetical protein
MAAKKGLSRSLRREVRVSVADIRQALAAGLKAKLGGLQRRGRGPGASGSEVEPAKSSGEVASHMVTASNEAGHGSTVGDGASGRVRAVGEAGGSTKSMVAGDLAPHPRLSQVTKVCALADAAGVGGLEVG